MAKPAEPFTPPTDEQVRDHLSRHTPRQPSKLQAWAPLLLLAGALVAALTLGGTPAAVLPWLLLLALLLSLGRRQRQARKLESRVNHVLELTMLRRCPEALRAVWRMLPNLTTFPPLYGRAVALLAHNLDHLRAYDAAIVAYSELIENLPGTHPWSVQLQLHRAMAQLANDELTSADEALRRLRSVNAGVADAATTAAWKLACLIQQARTYHWPDAADQAGTLLEDLRPLGVDAAWGHALLALSLHQLSRNGGAANDMGQRAGLWWGRATTLLPPAVLTARFPELRVLADELPATTWPLNPPVRP